MVPLVPVMVKVGVNEDTLGKMCGLSGVTVLLELKSDLT
jgi:hypothetical protein